MIQRIAQLFGVGFLLFGVLGFVASGMSMDANMDTAPKLFGLFPVNVLHNVVHLVFGVWGLLAARTAAGATQYAKIGGGIYLVLVVLGLVAPTTFGLIPIGGNNIWLHVVLGAGLLLGGFTAGKKVTTA